MTSTPIADSIQPAGAHAAMAAPSPGASHVQAVHHNLARFAGILPHLLRGLEAIALDPRVDELVQAALEAAGAGVADGVFASVTRALREHAAMQPARPQSLPAPGGAARPAGDT